MKFTGCIREPEKLTANFPALKLPLSGGYEEGYADGRAAGYTEGEQTATAEAEAHNAAILTDCNAVLPDKGVEPADTLEQVPQRIGEIKAEPKWVNYMTNGLSLFKDVTFPENTELVVEIPMLKNSLSSLCSRTVNLTHLKVICKEDNGMEAYLDGIVEYSKQLVVLDLTEFNRTVYSFYCSFRYADHLEEIRGELKPSPIKVSADSNTFAGCIALREVRFVPGSVYFGAVVQFANCSKLSDASIQSIIDGLADLTGTTAQTLTFHRDVYDRLTEEQKATVAAKNWTLVRA